MSEKKITAILSFFEKELGFSLDGTIGKKAIQLIQKNMEDRKILSDAQYLSFLKSSKGKIDFRTLLEKITVGETYFFRNPRHWQVFSSVVLPKILENKAPDQLIRLWSAGCSTGEEAYTIAICLYEKKLLNLKNFRIIAGDINGEAIRKARKGIYPANSFRGVDEYYKNKYFRKSKKGLQIIDEIRELVEFTKINLMYPYFFLGKDRFFHAIFCRNVLMYFHPRAIDSVQNFFYDCLKQEGFLFLGHAETRLLDPNLFIMRDYDQCFLFQKKIKDSIKPTHKIPDRLFPEKKEKYRIDRRTKKRILFEPIKQDKPIKQEVISSEIRIAMQVSPILTSEDLLDEARKNYYDENYSAVIDSFSKRATKQLHFDEMILLSLSYLQMSKFAQAQYHQEQAMQKSDLSPEPHMLKSLIAEFQGDLHKTIISNQAAIYLDNSFFCPLFRLAHIYEERDKKKSVLYFKRTLLILPRDKEDRIRLFCGEVSHDLLAEICVKRCES